MIKGIIEGFNWRRQEYFASLLRPKYWILSSSQVPPPLTWGPDLSWLAHSFKNITHYSLTRQLEGAILVHFGEDFEQGSISSDNPVISVMDLFWKVKLGYFDLSRQLMCFTNYFIIDKNHLSFENLTTTPIFHTFRAPAKCIHE